MPYSEIIPSGIEGSFILTPKTFGDDRGWYSPRTEVAELAEISGIDLHNFTQIAESFNAESGILRGLHYQLSPNEQGKLVRVIFGAVYDVALDLRLGSPTFGKAIGVELSEDNNRQLWVPEGCAHGYMALKENTLFTYLVTGGRYNKDSERGVNPFDPDLKIDWPIPHDKVKALDRDLSFRNLKDIPENELFKFNRLPVTSLNDKS